MKREVKRGHSSSLTNVPANVAATGFPVERSWVIESHPISYQRIAHVDAQAAEALSHRTVIQPTRSASLNKDPISPTCGIGLGLSNGPRNAGTVPRDAAP